MQKSTVIKEGSRQIFVYVIGKVDRKQRTNRRRENESSRFEFTSKDYPGGVIVTRGCITLTVTGSTSQDMFITVCSPLDRWCRVEFVTTASRTPDIGWCRHGRGLKYCIVDQHCHVTIDGWIVHGYKCDMDRIEEKQQHISRQ